MKHRNTKFCLEESIVDLAADAMAIYSSGVPWDAMGQCDMSHRVSCPIPSLWYTVTRWTHGIEAYSTWDCVGHPFSVFDFGIHKGSPKVPLDS